MGVVYLILATPTVQYHWSRLMYAAHVFDHPTRPVPVLIHPWQTEAPYYSRLNAVQIGLSDRLRPDLNFILAPLPINLIMVNNRPPYGDTIYAKLFFFLDVK